MIAKRRKNYNVVDQKREHEVIAIILFYFLVEIKTQQKEAVGRISLGKKKILLIERFLNHPCGVVIT